MLYLLICVWLLIGVLTNLFLRYKFGPPPNKLFYLTFLGGPLATMALILAMTIVKRFRREKHITKGK